MKGPNKATPRTLIYTYSMIENNTHMCLFYFSFLFCSFHFLFYFILFYFLFFLHIYKYTCSKANQERPKDGIKKWINSPQISIYHKLSLMMWPSQAKDPWINVRRIDSGKWHDYPPCNELRMITTRGGESDAKRVTDRIKDAIDEVWWNAMMQW